MALNQMLLPEFDREMGLTRRLLERVPEEKLDWQPHTKSMRMGRLAGHLAELPSYMTQVLRTDEVDLAPPGGGRPAPATLVTRAQILAAFDENVAAARAALADASDAQLGRPWTLKKAGKMMFTMPRMLAIRNLVMNHTIHHRAQLGLCLRLNDVPIPSMYGPSADEEM
jgi:uncharacterized damage-inducible protein DinB